MEHWKNLSLDDIEGEEWRQVIGFAGFYDVSSFGRVKSLRRPTVSGRGGIRFEIEKILMQHANNGYLQVNLTTKNNARPKFVHRIVAQAFIPNPFNKPQVNHKNSNRSDNRLENLEWATRQEDSDHASINNRIPFGINHHRAIFTEEDVIYIRKNYIKGHRYKKGNLKFLMNKFGVSQYAIWSVIHRLTWKRVL